MKEFKIGDQVVYSMERGCFGAGRGNPHKKVFQEYKALILKDLGERFKIQIDTGKNLIEKAVLKKYLRHLK